MAKDVFDSIMDALFGDFFDSSWKGKYGEKLTARELKLVRFFGRDGKILRNVYIPKDNGQTSEIDVMFITEKGIFVIESKNYSGWIFGKESDSYWTAMLANKQKNRFYNPIRQNRTHIKWLGNYLGDRIPLYSIIAFSERCELKSVTVDSGDIKVIKRDYLYGTIRRIWEQAESVLTEKEVNELYENLKSLTEVDDAVKAAHIKSIEERYKKPAERMMPEAPAGPVKAAAATGGAMKVCPRCGRRLVLRTARKGGHAGEQFYGCSGFPKCRYSESI